MAQTTSVPLYRVTVVQGSARAINYRNLKHSTEIDLLGTVLVANASGEARVKSEDGAIEITAKFKNLPPATTFGGEFLTYVLWGISPEGRASNLGEVVLKNGKGRVKVIEKLQTFGLVVTAEPYFAVSQPSNVIVLENAVRKGSKEQFEFIDAKYELLKRGQYTLNLNPLEPAVLDSKTPFEVYQARNAVRIAAAAGAQGYAPEAYGKAQAYLIQAETHDGGNKGRIIAAREAVQRAEDSRLIAVQKQDVERVAMEQKQAQDVLSEAKRETAAANVAGEEALQKARDSDTENAGLRAKNEGLQVRNDDLKTRLMAELNAVLQTKTTARGLIVNMSGMLFENGKATLLPAAREKLAKIAGILSTHKGLRIEAEGFTDSNGTEASNQVLSEKRAQNTKDYLVQQGVKAEAITFKGFGEGHPVATNDTAAGRQENRRVELVVSGEGLTAPKDAGL
ncbi:MAG: OmpA family protein [Acidobacteria bacterium]|nr:OmpA family protein [Acidobacteriota bacterium]MBI3487205.1 OmpA family protein [Acidobacteriota bacterium]